MSDLKNMTLEQIALVKAVAVVRLNSDKNINGLAEALISGGIPIIEITLTTPNAVEIISQLSKEFGNEIVVGAGSVLNAEAVERTINAGARYIVSPVMKHEIITKAKLLKTPVMIGAFTPTEIQTAHELGADMIKVFPADILGMKFFKSVLAPMPHLKLMPTGGVNLDNAGEWLAAGARAVGVGSALVNSNDVESGEFTKIKSNALRVIQSIKNFTEKNT